MMPPMSADRRFVSGNELLGRRLYEKLENFLIEHLDKITDVCICIVTRVYQSF